MLRTRNAILPDVERIHGIITPYSEKGTLLPRSIAVTPAAKGLGAGRKLVEALLDEAERHRVTCVCLFTRIPEFFKHMGFTVATREELPDKIYKDCVHCPNLHDCDEIAMVRGTIPKQIGPHDPLVLLPVVRLRA